MAIQAKLNYLNKIKDCKRFLDDIEVGIKFEINSFDIISEFYC